MPCFVKYLIIFIFYFFCFLITVWIIWFKISGLAQSGMICDPGNSCAVVEDNGLGAAFTVVHEIGHM